MQYRIYHMKTLLPPTVIYLFPSPHAPYAELYLPVGVSPFGKLPAGHTLCLELGHGESRNQTKCYSLILDFMLWGLSRSWVAGPGASSLPNWPPYLILILQTELLGIASEQHEAQEPLSVREWRAIPCRRPAWVMDLEALELWKCSACDCIL